MKRASLRDLRYRFGDVERLLEQGEKIEVTRRNRVIAQLIPVGSPSGRRPDFLARLHAIYGQKAFAVTNAELSAAERDRY